PIGGKDTPACCQSGKDFAELEVRSSRIEVVEQHQRWCVLWSRDIVEDVPAVLAVNACIAGQCAFQRLRRLQQMASSDNDCATCHAQRYPGDAAPERTEPSHKCISILLRRSRRITRY